MCTDVHKKEVKLKEVRLGDIYHFNKRKGFGLRRMINLWKMTRKYMEKLTEGNGYLSKACWCEFIFKSPVVGVALPFLMLGGGTFAKRHVCPAFR